MSDGSSGNLQSTPDNPFGIPGKGASQVPGGHGPQNPYSNDNALNLKTGQWSPTTGSGLLPGQVPTYNPNNSYGSNQPPVQNFNPTTSSAGIATLLAGIKNNKDNKDNKAS